MAHLDVDAGKPNPVSSDLSVRAPLPDRSQWLFISVALPDETLDRQVDKRQ
jgi:hypothetical protein